MIAILGSLLLLLYVFLPEFLFTTLALNFRKVNRASFGRYGDVLSSAAVGLLPFVAAYLASRWFWFVGHWPFPVPEDVSAKYADYRTVVTALYSEAFFREHVDATWLAWSHIRLHQGRFLVWMYLALSVQTACVILLTHYFGSLSQYAWYRRSLGKLFLRRASQWEVLLTGFTFPRKRRPRVAVDAITTDSHLYAGTVADFFLRADGELSGLLLSDVERFQLNQLEDDRKAGLTPDSRDYWKEIPGANFYLPAEKIANLNIRYEAPEQELLEGVGEWMKDLDPGSTITVTLEATSEPFADGHSAKPVGNARADDPDSGIAS